jgi:hypothetical protein
MKTARFLGRRIRLYHGVSSVREATLTSSEEVYQLVGRGNVRVYGNYCYHKKHSPSSLRHMDKQFLAQVCTERGVYGSNTSNLYLVCSQRRFEPWNRPRRTPA